ncbi:hypothetical protein [Amycolatopsis sp. FDAARGOS 1241]|uniref:hypothetical protein n=1 Tax=Amycolatopsis sp. FDAARGOS 1241 TaxID=2778070 RepID=UPI00194DEC12|nr:hypothetical protein [Amycolatopsis sp. FDAARGOS 1241]QRP42647.1 hypothetical protein I6J71_24395 [Amycolatopsis sp. FDAARGOS 1241]
MIFEKNLGETCAGEKVQLEADRKWFPIAPARWPRLEVIVQVVDGAVARVRGVEAEPAKWDTDDPRRPDSAIRRSGRHLRRL